MHKLTTLVLTATVALAGCASVQPTFTSAGTPGYRVSCGGIFGDGDLGGCYQNAGATCQGQGFRVLQNSVSSMIFECKTVNSDTQIVAPTELR